VYSNLYATTPNGAYFWRLSDIPIKQTLADGLVAMGELNPRFSHDGKQLAWTERFADGGRWGKWRIHLGEE